MSSALINFPCEYLKTCPSKKVFNFSTYSILSVLKHFSSSNIIGAFSFKLLLDYYKLLFELLSLLFKTFELLRSADYILDKSFSVI